MATLEELLALLPDNSTGAIDAADLRTIVTELYVDAQMVAQVFGYAWQVQATNPSNGRATLSSPWGLGDNNLRVNITTDSGLTLTFAVLDALQAVQILIVGSNGGTLHASKTGPSVDAGTYRDIPMLVSEIEGSPPINNEKVSVVIRGIVP